MKRTAKNAQLSVRVPAALRQKLVEMAERNGVSTTWLYRFILLRAMQSPDMWDRYIERELSERGQI